MLYIFLVFACYYSEVLLIRSGLWLCENVLYNYIVLLFL